MKSKVVFIVYNPTLNYASFERTPCTIVKHSNITASSLYRLNKLAFNYKVTAWINPGFSLIFIHPDFPLDPTTGLFIP
jgi:hypothetical protein